VADIVAAAGLSNDAFYRHFPSKDALVAALLEDGAQRLARYVAHQMSKEPSPEGQVRRWVEGVLSQTREEIAATTLAVLWNGGRIGESVASGRHSAAAPLATLLREPFAQLGSASPALDASLAARPAPTPSTAVRSSPVTTTMEHCRCSDHDDGALRWLARSSAAPSPHRLQHEHHAPPASGCGTHDSAWS
jgi:AcrR family transcriptional regulator